MSAKIERRIYSEQFPPEEGATESPTPAPSSSAPLTPESSAGVDAERVGEPVTG